MNETIREQQMRRLRESLQSESFNTRFAWYEACGRPLGVAAPEGRWYISQADLDAIFAADGRGLVGRVFDTSIVFWKPQS